MQLVWYNKSLVRRVIAVTIHYPNGQQPVQHYNTHNELPTPHQSIYAKRGMSLEDCLLYTSDAADEAYDV